MQLHQLAYALAVAEEQSFTRAAARLHLAQPSLSRQVRLLEHELGVVLFNRGPGPGSGHPHARRGRARCPSCSGSWPTWRPPGPRRGPSRAWPGAAWPSGPRPSLITSALAPALVAFHASHPGIDLSVVEAGSHQLVPQVAAGEVDLALVVLPVTDPLVVTTPLFDDPLVLATAPDHPFARAAPGPGARPRRARPGDVPGGLRPALRHADGLPGGGGRAASGERGGRDGRRPLLRGGRPRRGRGARHRAARRRLARRHPLHGADAEPHRRPGPAGRPRPGPPGPRPGRPAAARDAPAPAPAGCPASGRCAGARTAPPFRLRGPGFRLRPWTAPPTFDPSATPRPGGLKPPADLPGSLGRPARLGLGVGVGGRGDAAQHRQAHRRRRVRSSPACSASRTPWCPSWRTPSWPGTTSSSWASAARPRRG